MENNNLTVLRSKLSWCITSVADKIRPSISEKATIKSNVWVNKSNMIMAYLSYYPNGDLTEDSIDATIELTLANESALFSVGICWSNGEIIEDIMNIDFVVVSSNQLLQEVDRLSKSATDELIDHFRSLLK